MFTPKWVKWVARAATVGAVLSGIWVIVTLLPLPWAILAACILVIAVLGLLYG